MSVLPPDDAFIVHDMSQFMTDDLSCPSIRGPAFKKSKWSIEEDELLKESVGTHGLANWTVVAQCIPGRNGKQCRERWMNQLCPALNKDTWTPQEDLVLIQQQHIYGNVWSHLAQYLPGRSANAVKNRWSWLSRHSLSTPRTVPFALLVRRPQPIVRLSPVMPLIPPLEMRSAPRPEGSSLSDPTNVHDELLNSGTGSSDFDQGWMPFGLNPLCPESTCFQDSGLGLDDFDPFKGFDDSRF
jgi:hypothetical protein